MFSCHLADILCDRHRSLSDRDRLELAKTLATIHIASLADAQSGIDTLKALAHQLRATVGQLPTQKKPPAEMYAGAD